LSQENFCDENQTAYPGALFAWIGRFRAAAANASDPICVD
jgi:hypothetical protein